jgi:flagellar hook protein FlgE
LTKLGSNTYAPTADSGQPITGVANSAGIGKILSSSLELSNVDLAQQFVKMIEYQRGFQANSRVITTTDELLQELVNLKR